MKRITLIFISALALASCSRYQTSSSPGQATTRIDTVTGKTEVLTRTASGKMEWRPVAEATPTARPEPPKQADCSASGLSPKTREIIGAQPCN